MHSGLTEFSQIDAQYLRYPQPHSVDVLKGQIMFTTKSSRVIRVATSAVVCVALALGTAGVALAGQGSHSRDHSSFNSRDHGDWNGASGVVTAFTTTSITLK